MWNIPNYEEKKKNIEETLKRDDISNKTRKIFEIMKKYYSEDEREHNEGCSEFIESMRHYVYQIIHQKYGSYVHDYFSDLYSEGVIGILADLPNYDPTKSTPTTYFDIRIKHQINGYINNQINKISAHYVANMNKINKAILKLQQNGSIVTNQGIAIETKLSADTVIQTIRINEAATNVQSCDANDFDVDKQLVSNDLSPEELYLRNETIDELKHAIDCLPELERNIVRMKYGIDTFMRTSYTEISDELSKIMGYPIPVNKVRDAYQQSIKRLRRILSETGRFTDNVKIKRESILDSTEITLVKPMSDEALNELSEEYLSYISD